MNLLRRNLLKISLVLIFASLALVISKKLGGTFGSVGSELGASAQNRKEGANGIGKQIPNSSRRKISDPRARFLGVKNDPAAICELLPNLLDNDAFSDPDLYEAFLKSLVHFDEEQLALVLDAWLREDGSSGKNPSMLSVTENIWKLLLASSKDPDFIFQRGAEVWKGLSDDGKARKFWIRQMASEMPSFEPKHLKSLLSLKLSPQEKVDIISKMKGRLSNLHPPERRLAYAEKFLIEGVDDRNVREMLGVEIINTELEQGVSLRSIGEWALTLGGDALGGADGQIVWKSMENKDFKTATWYLEEMVKRQNKSISEKMLGNFIKIYATKDPTGLSDWALNFSNEEIDFKNLVLTQTLVQVGNVDQVAAEKLREAMRSLTSNVIE